MSLIVCLSHREDADGILSAALVKAAYKSKFTSIILADYANLTFMLEKIAYISASSNNAANSEPYSSWSPFSSLYEKMGSSNYKIGKLFICDLGLSTKNKKRFVDLVGSIISNGVKVTYID